MKDNDISPRPRNLCWGLAVVGAFLFCLGVVILLRGQCSAMVPTLAAAANVVLLSLMGGWRCALARSQALEENAARQYRQEHGKTELFEDADEAVRLATRANQQYMKYAVPVLTVLLGVAEIFFCLIVWRRWNSTPAFVQALNPMPLAILAVCSCIVVLIAGSYFLGASRERGCRWLRPAGAWLFFTGFLFLAAGIALFLEFFGKGAALADIYVARGALIALFALAIELVFSFVIEFYRPRMPGEEERPLPESRILALFTEPGGVARNVAASLDYQFGFQVSEVWFYRFLERTVMPLLCLMAVALWLQTCVIVVGTEENGIMESFGRVVSKTPMKPGIYFKLPAPFERVIRFPVEHIQTLTLGESHGEEEEGEEEHERIVLWSSQNAEEENNFIVALPPESGAVNARAGENGQTSIGLVAAHIPLYYKVSNMYDYIYNQYDPAKTLRNLATRELIRYMAQSNFNDLLGAERQKAGEILCRRIQDAADAAHLGVEVVFVSLAGLHPPLNVGGAYDQVMASKEQRETFILQAQAFAAARKPEAEAVRHQLLNASEAYRTEKTRVSRAEAVRFEQQLKAYAAAPELFQLNCFLDVFQNEGAGVRKYLLTGRPDQEVFSLDLQKKINASLLDMNLDSTSNP